MHIKYPDIFTKIGKPCVSLEIQNPGIMTILEYSEPLQNYIPTHFQNLAIFTKTGKPCVTLEIKNPGILAILEYSEP